MSEMVERVARAICRANGEDPDEPGYGFLGGGAPTSYAWQGYASHARVAIQAMREPTESMTAAAYAEPAVALTPFAPHYWRRMIDEALK